MAYNTNTPRAEYTASATQTVFPFLFKIFATSDIKVYQTLAGATPDDVADILVLTTDYTVTINGDAGGEVTLNIGAAVNDKITLARNLSVTRATEYQQNGDLLASTLNSDQEYQTYLIADNVSNDSRYIKVPDSVQNVSTSLPAPVSDAYIKWNATADAIENDTTIPDAVTTSTANATASQLYEWEAEAERLTADSYATEAEDTFVNLVTSDGDGTFTYTPTTDYSALHYKNKAQASAASIDLNLLSPRATTITPPTDADYTLTAIENGYGRFILNTSAWTTPHNVIVDTSERSFLVDNSAGTYTATVKTSAGTGIPVLAGTKVWLLCDGTNVIESVSVSNCNIIGNDFLAKVKTNQIASNVLFGAYKGISVLGDSITHGAFALNSFNHSWGRVFQKMANVDLQSKSYGVINFLSLGSGGTTTTDIHTVSFTGSWNASNNGLETLMGSALSNTAVNDEINIAIPSFQNNGNLNYIQSIGGGTFELYINGVLHSTTNTSGALSPYAIVSFPVTDNGKGKCNIKIKVTVGTCEISTIQYYKGTTALVNLFASSGRKLSEVTDSTIELVCANSSTLVMSLGHNDTYNTELVSRIDKLITECNANGIALVIPNFRWNLGANDLVNQELVRLHESVPNSIYIPFHELFKNDGSTVDGTYTVTTLGLFSDASHPNKAGHKLIAETIAKEMKLSVTSKEEANTVYNYTLPLALNTGTTLENIAIVSSVKWNNSNLTVNCYIRMAASGAFPTGTHIIQTAWDSKYEVPSIRQSWQGVTYIRNDTGAIVSIASLSSAGAITLYVLSSFVTNQSFEFSVGVQ